MQKRLARGLVEAGAVAVGAALFVAVALVAMSSWASPAGFLEYVLVKGSLPKGGPEKIWANLTGYFDDAALSAGLSLGLILLMEAAARRTPLREMRYSSRQILFSITALALVSDGISWLPLLAGSSPIAARVIVQRAAVFGGFQKLLLIIVLAGAACSILEARLSNRRWLRDWGPRLRQPPGILLVGLAAFSAAIGHNLSVPDFRWGYDNNPLVFFVALSATGIVGSTLLRPPRMFQAVTALTLVSLLVYVGLGVADQLRVIAGARIPWPEISELQGVFLRPQGEGARRLTARVRDYAAASDTVLLLPNDPEVESWFERPRPRLSSLILFPDQYLDEKVDEDLARLERDLPKAIVIGPRLGWRRFARNWHPGRGAERFIDRVQAEILPKHYALAETVSVYWERNADMMDIYLRK